MSTNYPVLMEREKSEFIYNIKTWFALGAKRANLKKYTAYKILTITFVNNKSVPNTAEASWDVSLNEDGNIIAWVIPNAEDSTKYDLFIGADSEKITATQSTSSDGEYKIFYGYSSCFEINNLSMLDTSQIEDFKYTFGGNESLTSLDLSNFNTSNATNMNYMFGSCRNLTSLDLSNFNTSKVTDMSDMFGNCSNLTSLDLSKFNTSNVTNMYAMFAYCGQLTSLDLSKFNTSKVTNMSYMFGNCDKLTTIYCNNDWKTDKITDSLGMFRECLNLKGAISYDSTKIDINYANPDTGYFSYLPIPAIPFLANLDIRQNQIKNVVIDKLSQEPSSPVVGQTYYNTTDNKVYTYNGTTWDILTNESEILYIPYKNEYTTDDYNKYYPKVVSAIQNNNVIFLKQDNPYAIYFIPLHTFAQSETNNLTLVFAIIEASSIDLVNKAYIGKFNMLFDTTNNSITTETTSFELVPKEEGKGLSTNDYTEEEKAKLAGLNNYTLPVASDTTLGGVKAGENVNIGADGTLNVTGGGEISNAENTNIQVLKIWVGTQAQFNAITALDANTEYNIIEE